MRLFKVNAAVEPWLDIEVIPVESAKLSVVSPVAVITNFSMFLELTAVVVALNLAVIVSTPSPPSSTSPLLRVSAVDASKVSLALEPIMLFRPVVRVKVFLPA